VEQVVYEILRYEVKDQECNEQFGPHGELDEVEDAEFVGAHPMEDTNRSQSEEEIDEDSGTEEDHVYSGVFPFAVRQLKEWEAGFEDPAEAEAGENPD